MADSAGSGGAARFEEPAGASTPFRSGSSSYSSASPYPSASASSPPVSTQRPSYASGSTYASGSMSSYASGSAYGSGSSYAPAAPYSSATGYSAAASRKSSNSDYASAAASDAAISSPNHAAERRWRGGNLRSPAERQLLGDLGKGLRNRGLLQGAGRTQPRNGRREQQAAGGRDALDAHGRPTGAVLSRPLSESEPARGGSQSGLAGVDARRPTPAAAPIRSKRATPSSTSRETNSARPPAGRRFTS